MSDQEAAARPDWPTCNTDGCIGVPMEGQQACLAHVDQRAREAFLTTLKPGSDVDLRGVPLDSLLLGRLLAAMQSEEKHPVLGKANFRRAQFQGYAQFRDAQFQGYAEFRDAQFSGNARFDRATFHHRASFRGARFLRDARFMGARFCYGVALDEAYFAAERVLGPMLVEGRLALDETIAERHLVVEAFTRQLTCIGAEFRGGATIQLRWAEVVLDKCAFGRPSTVSFAQRPFRERRGGFSPQGGLGPPLFTEEEEKANKGVGQPRPRLLSIRGVDVSNLALVDLDLTCCLFQDARNWAGLRIEGAQPFACTPDNKVRLFQLVPLWRRWTHRQVLAEEQTWRECRFPATWNAPACQSLGWLPNVTGQQVDQLYPNELELIYRALRKAQEDSKNEPGAADFYYGEMEMRRHAARARGWSVERAVLAIYWLVSGYALRAWRAFATLGVVIALAAVIFATIGFKPPDTPRFVPVGVTATGQLVYQQQEAPRPSLRERLPGAFGYSAEVATSLLRGPERPVTAVGEWTQASLRWLGPALFALALLSLRGRVKR